MTSREQELAGLAPGSDLPRSRLPGLLERLVEPFRRGAAPEPHQATGFYTDTTVCIGCKACEVACKQWNQLPADGFDWTGNSYDNTGELSATSWRHVKFIEQFPDKAVPVLPGPDSDAFDPARWLMMSDVCKHCVAAPCQQACPTGAIIHNEFGNVYIQPDICNGCAYCIAACPFGVITRSTIDGHAHKCTLCYDRQHDGLVPACAKACPTAVDPVRPDRRAAGAGPAASGRAARARRCRCVPVWRCAEPETYSALNSFYLLLDRPSVYGLPEAPVNPWLHMKGDYLRAVLGVLAAARGPARGAAAHGALR